MFPRSKIQSPETLALALPLSLVVGGGAIVASALLWGWPGMVAAAWGTGFSLVNVWVLARLGARAARRAADEGEPDAAAAGLQSALSAKTAILIVLISLFFIMGGARVQPAAFAIGLLVSVVGLVLAGLLGEAGREARR